MGINIATDWSAVLREQGRFADRMTRDIAEALAAPGLSHEEAWVLFNTIHNCRRSFDELVLALGKTGNEPAYRRAVATLDNLWSGLSSLAASRVDDLRD